MIKTTQIFYLLICLILISCSSNKKSTNDDSNTFTSISIQDSLNIKNDLYFTYDINTIRYEASNCYFINKDLSNYICLVFNEKCPKRNVIFSKDYLENLLKQHQEFLQKDYTNSDDDFMPIEIQYTINIEEKYSKNNIKILEKNQYSYTGGAHGNYYTQYSCYDVKEREILDIKNIFDVVELNKLGQEYFLMQRGLQKNIKLEESGYWFENDEFYLPNNFTIENNSFVFVFNPYEIASYAEGMIEIRIPFNRIRNTIKEEYKFIIN